MHAIDMTEGDFHNAVKKLHVWAYDTPQVLHIHSPSSWQLQKGRLVIITKQLTFLYKLADYGALYMYLSFPVWF